MENLGNVLNRFIQDIGIEKKIKSYQVFSIWSRAVGEQMAAVARPIRLSDGKMFVEVKNDVWRNELYYHRNDIIKKVNHELGFTAIQEIVLM